MYFLSVLCVVEHFTLQFSSPFRNWFGTFIYLFMVYSITNIFVDTSEHIPLRPQSETHRQGLAQLAVLADQGVVDDASGCPERSRA